MNRHTEDRLLTPEERKNHWKYGKKQRDGRQEQWYDADNLLKDQDTKTARILTEAHQKEIGELLYYLEEPCPHPNRLFPKLKKRSCTECMRNIFLAMLHKQPDESKYGVKE